MAREIIKDDIPKIKNLMLHVLDTDEYVDLSRMGGLTNHTYKIVLTNGNEYVVRIPGEGTEELIVRSDEMIGTRLACELGIDAELLYFDETGAKVTRYISNAVTMSADSLKKPEHIEQVVPFEVFDMAKGYEKIIDENNVSMFEDYQEVKAEVMRIKEEIDEMIEIQKVPCHNDPLCENWVKGDGRMYLIDWEYAGMNDGMWDLADVSIEAGYDEACDEMLLCAYMEKEPDILDKKHFLASKIYVDYLWTLWAKTRVPYDGQPMEDWAVERYLRLKSFVKEYKEI